MKNMKKIIYLAIATIALSSCIHMRTIFPSGDIITLSRSVGSFNKVEVSAGISLYAYNGEQEVLIETYENIQNHVQVYVRNNTLYIKPENQISFGGNTRIRAYVTAEIIECIEASGGSKVMLNEGLTANRISLEGTGGSQFEGSTE